MTYHTTNNKNSVKDSKKRELFSEFSFRIFQQAMDEIGAQIKKTIERVSKLIAEKQPGQYQKVFESLRFCEKEVLSLTQIPNASMAQTNHRMIEYFKDVVCTFFFCSF